MKQIYFSIKISLFITLMILSQNAFAQCSITYDQNGTTVVTDQPYLWGQGFTAECDGDLEYVQFTSNSTGTVSAGTINIYSGNTVSGPSLYTQSYPSITINQVNDPIRVDITGTLNLVQSNKYTFEFTVDNVNVLADFNGGYSGGTAFQDGVEASLSDIIFVVSIFKSNLSISDFNENKNINLFPNPSNDYVAIFNLQETENYRIVNALGQEVLKGDIINSGKIDIRNLNSGLYYLKLENGNILKFIKE